MLIVAVPEFAPSVNVAAAPPIERDVAPELKRVAVPAVVVISPPLSARSPDEVISPLLATMKRVTPDAVSRVL